MSHRDWYVGMKVVCVFDLSDHPLRSKWGVIVPERNRTYTIRDIFLEPTYGDAGPFVRLAEIVNAKSETELGPYEAAFDCKFFRPVELRKPDISIFTAMLNPKRERVDA